MSEGVISSVEINFEANSYNLVDSNRLLTETTRQNGLGESYRGKQKNADQHVVTTSLNPNSTDAEQAKFYIDHFEREALRCSRSQHPNSVRRLDRGRYQAHYLYAVFEAADALAAGRETAVIRMTKKSEALRSDSASSKHNHIRASFLSSVLAVIPIEHYFSKPDQNYGTCMNEWRVLAA